MNKENIEVTNTEEVLDNQTENDLVEKLSNQIVSRTAEKLKSLDRIPAKESKGYLDETKDETPSFYESKFRKNLADLRDFKQSSFKLKTVSRAANETTDSAGGYYTFDQKGDEVINIPNQYGLARQLTTIKPMNSDRMTFPKVTTDLLCYVVAEGLALTGSQQVLGQVVLAPKKIAAICPITNELFKDAAYPLEQEVFQGVTKDFAKKEDEAFLVGNGVNFTGIAYASGVNAVTGSTSGVAFSANSMSAEVVNKLSDMMTAVENANTTFDKGAVWFMSPSFKGTLRTLRDGQGQFIFNNGNPALGFPDTVFGKPVYTTNVLPNVSVTASGTKHVIYGDPKQVYTGLRQDLEVQLFNEGTIGSDSLLEKDMSAYRIIERIDFQVVRPDAFAVLQSK